MISPTTKFVVTPSDAELVTAAGHGDREAFGELVVRHQNLVCSIAFALTGSLSQSEDVAQDAFVAAWSRLGELRNPESFRRWLRQIVQNVAIDSLRKRRSDVVQLGRPDEDMTSPSNAPSPLDSLISQEEQTLVRRALRRVPEAYRVALVLYYREEKSVEKVAAALELSETNVKQRLLRGRRNLLEHVEKVLESALGGTRPGAAFTVLVVAAVAGSARPASASRSAPARSPGRGFIIKSLAGATLTLGIVGAVTLAAQLRERRQPAAASGDRAPHVPPLSAPPAAPGERALVRAADLPSRVPPLFDVRGAVPDPPPVPRIVNRLVTFDFEDGLFPERALDGVTAPCPPRPGNAYCLTGVLKGKYLMATFGDRVFRYAKSFVVGLDYYLGKESTLAVQISSKISGTNYIWLKHMRPGAWTHVDVPLKDAAPINLQGGPTGGKHLQDGEELMGLYFSVRYAEGQELHIDNLTLTDVGP